MMDAMIQFGIRLSACVLAAVLASCGGGRPPVFGGPDAALVPAEELCLSESCGSSTFLAAVLDAENILYASSGQVFVSGGTNVFEVTRLQDQSYELRPLAQSDCNFTGLAERDGTVYAACADLTLYAMALSSGDPLQPIYTLEDMGLPNGMAVGSDDCLYIVDGPLSTTALPSPKVVRVCFAANPFEVVQQEVWLEEGLALPNGIARYAEGFVLSNSSLLPMGSQVLELGLNSDGSPSTPELLYSRVSVFDDLSVVGEHMLASDYLGGNVFLLNRAGEVLQQTQPLGFAFPSSVQLVGPPHFQVGDILITAKGLLGDTFSSFGNALYLFRSDAQSP